MSDDIGESREEIEQLVEDTSGSKKVVSPQSEGVEDDAAATSKVPAMPPLMTLDKIATCLLLGAMCLFVRSFLVCLCIPYAFLMAFTLWLGAVGVYMAISSQKLSVDGKNVLITGCDTGFGYSLAFHLDKMGFRVFALCLMDGEGAKELRASGSSELHVLIGDVTNQDHLKRARKQVEEILPKGEGLWGLVNNAGIAAFGDLEWLPMTTYKKISEVNVFGLINATQTFLPLIRRAQGRVVNVASMLGRMGVPMRSPYVMSKYAVEGLSDCLRHEMKQWGVSVIIVEPGNFIAGTNIFTEEGVEKSAKEMWSNMAEEVRQDYGEDMFQERVRLMKSYITGGNTDLSTVTDAFVNALTDKSPQARYQPMDLYYKTRIFVATHLPEWIYDNIYVGCLNK